MNFNFFSESYVLQSYSKSEQIEEMPTVVRHLENDEMSLYFYFCTFEARFDWALQLKSIDGGENYSLEILYSRFYSLEKILKKSKIGKPWHGEVRPIICFLICLKIS